MRLTVASSLFALVALEVTAQDTTDVFSFTSVPTRTAEIQPSATETATGLISTSSACAQISDIVMNSELESPSVQAELAYDCLLSVPFSSDAATTTIDGLLRMAQFQSTLSYLKTPPAGYVNDPVDIVQGLQDIKTKVEGGKYNDEFTFETDIAALLGKAHDGHFAFEGMAFNGAFRWRRSRQVALISGSLDGGIPKIWAIQDFNNSAAAYTPSPITRINGQDAVTLLQNEAELSTYHDPDTRWNTMFYMQASESYGYFTSPRYYPGPSVNVTFENGTTHTYINAAVIQDITAWGYISDGETFYETYIVPSTGNSKFKKRETTRLPTLLEHPRDISLSKRYVPNAYPEPFIQHSAPDIALAGYFLTHPNVSDLAALVVRTFNTQSDTDTEEFQMVIQEFLAEAVSRGTEKMIIDVRTNGGGKVFLGYDAFKQFFPSTEIQLQSRYRGHDASNLFGEQISTLQFSARTGEAYTSPFNYHSYDDKDLKSFNGWTDMYPPAQFNGDNFTDLLRYNLSDPLITSSDRYSIGITVTGYNDRSNFTKAPFGEDDIIILSDGICASTCSLFTEMMVQEAGVRTFAIGGRPQTGPMQPVGGTKGSLVLQSQYLTGISAYVVEEFASTRQEARQWQSFLPTGFGINANDASVNFQDNIRAGAEQAGVPTQFVNDTAACRIFYTPSMYLNVSEVWSAVADVAWGDGGKLDEQRCVSGSSTAEQQAASSASASASGSAKPTGSKGAAAAVGRAPEPLGMAPLVCGVVVLLSTVFGAALI